MNHPSDKFLDAIKYGNPSREDFNFMQKKTYLDRILPDMQKWPPPKNSSRATKEELNQLLEYSMAPDAQSRKIVFDHGLVPYIEQMFVNNGADPNTIHQISQGIVDDILPVITKLKYYFDRPRPFQLARYYDFRLYPNFSYFVSSPSFPSGHTTMATVICETLGNTYPEAYEAMTDFRKEVQESRLYMGVHYASDNNAAVRLAEAILNNPLFRTKYVL